MFRPGVGTGEKSQSDWTCPTKMCQRLYNSVDKISLSIFGRISQNLRCQAESLSLDQTHAKDGCQSQWCWAWHVCGGAAKVSSHVKVPGFILNFSFYVTCVFMFKYSVNEQHLH